MNVLKNMALKCHCKVSRTEFEFGVHLTKKYFEKLQCTLLNKNPFQDIFSDPEQNQRFVPLFRGFNVLNTKFSKDFSKRTSILYFKKYLSFLMLRIHCSLKVNLAISTWLLLQLVKDEKFSNFSRAKNRDQYFSDFLSKYSSITYWFGL